MQQYQTKKQMKKKMIWNMASYKKCLKSKGKSHITQLEYSIPALANQKLKKCRHQRESIRKEPYRDAVSVVNQRRDVSVNIYI